MFFIIGLMLNSMQKVSVVAFKIAQADLPARQCAASDGNT